MRANGPTTPAASAPAPSDNIAATASPATGSMTSSSATAWSARERLARFGDGRLGLMVAGGLFLSAIGVAGAPTLVLFGVTLAMTGVALISAGLVAGWERRRSALLTLRHERMDTVLEIAERLTRTFDRREIFRTIVTEVNRGLGADATTIRVLRGDVLEVAAWANMTDEAAARLPVFRRNEGRFGRIWATGRPWVCDDVAGERAHEGTYGRYDGLIDFASEIVVPLIQHDRVIGALTSISEQRRHWTDSDIAFVTALATHASIALNNAELFERTELRAAQLGVLRAAAARMSRENTIESIGRAIVEETRRIIDYHNARVYLLEPPDHVLPIAFEGTVGEYEKVDFAVLRTRIGVGFTGWVAGQGEPLLVNDANADPRGSTIPGTDDVDESMLVVPMRYDERVVGVITLSKLGLNQFDEDDLRLLMILADQSATAVETARLLGRSQALAAELRRLLDMGSALSQSLDPRAVADLIARHLAEAAGVDECAISYWDRAGDRLLTSGYYPTAAIASTDPYYSLSGYPMTRRVLNEGLVITIDADDPHADEAEVRLLREGGNRGLVMLPLVAKGASIGLVELFSKQALDLDASQVELARMMANEAAMALENATLYEEARRLADRDPLTSFYNHRTLHERLGEEIVRAGRSKRPLSLLMIDINDFKLVNDTFGHLFGDRVLVWIAERIRSTLRGSDVPARYGGDEFAVILPETDAAAANAAAERILGAFHDSAYESEERGAVPVAVSIGVATHPLDARTATEVIAVADERLYRMKRSNGEPMAGTGDDRVVPLTRDRRRSDGTGVPGTVARRY
jgi:diguanylate cyclase (GGDEF)-like protein